MCRRLEFLPIVCSLGFRIQGLGFEDSPIVSSMLPEEGETVAMIRVFVFPPSDSCKRRVSFDSLQVSGFRV
jgi:hypothetical protein